jgi:transmembrane protein 231
MAFYTLFTNPISVSYKAKLFSQSSLFYFICTIANLILPLIIIYRSDGLWRKIETFREQADVNFKHQLIVSLDLKDSMNGNTFWSSFPLLNNAHHSQQIRVPHVKASEAIARSVFAIVTTTMKT